MRKLIVVAAVLAGLAAWLYAARYGSTPAFHDAGGKVVPGSIAEMQRVTLGGVEQSIVIRGRNVQAPILIWLHGGPGTDETGMWRRNNAPLEDHFLVVYWVQRGTGRSFHSDMTPASMTLAHYVADLDQLVGLLQARFGPRRVALVGHSWGTNIGVNYAHAHPDKVSAYVGIGQIANSVEGERRSYAFTLAEARRRRDGEAVAALNAMGPPPYPLASIMQQRALLEKYGGGSFRQPTSLLSLLWQSFQASEITWLDGINFARGSAFSLGATAPQVAKFDWLHTATHFAVPVFIVAGRFDHNTDAALAHGYFKRIDAPFKRFRWFENSAHSPLFEEPAAFNAFMVNEVLPVVRARSQSEPSPVDSKAPGG